MELDPQGRDVRSSDPYALDGELANYHGTYEIAGNGFDNSGHGCEWNGAPFRCDLLGSVTRSQQVVGVGVRYQGNETPGFATGRVTRRWVQGGSSSRLTEGEAEYGPGVSDAEVEDSGFVWDLNDSAFLSGGDATLGRRLVLPRPVPQDRIRHVACDNILARIFGGPGAVASARFEPPGLLNADGTLRNPAHPDGVDRGDFGHSATPLNDYQGTSDRGGIIHLYANGQGLPGKVGLYVPKGFQQITTTRNERGQVVKLTPGTNNRRFYRNSAGIVIVFAHPATAGVTRRDVNKAGSTRIGNIGGPGGDGEDYFHTHIAFYSEYFGDPMTGTRVDPRKLFCGW